MDKSRIFLSPPYQTGDEQAALEHALASNWLAPAGPHLEDFEKALCDSTGFKYAVATSSGTAALHLALKIQGINPGDLVLASTLTFIGSINPIVYLNAKPVFIDSSKKSWNMDKSVLDQYLMNDVNKVKAIVPTHLYGMPADVGILEEIGRSRQVPIIHDLAECIGGKVGGKKIGDLARRGILSFNGNKMITTSGGGAFVTNDHNEAKEVLYLATQAKSEGHAYHHKSIGYNYRMSNLLAALGLAQIKNLDQRIAKKRTLFDRYKKALEPKGFRFQEEIDTSSSDRWLSAVLLPEGCSVAIDEIVSKMNEANIEVRPLWKPMHLQPVFANEQIIGGSVSEYLFNMGLCLPSGCGLSHAEQDFVIDQLLKITGKNV